MRYCTEVIPKITQQAARVAVRENPDNHPVMQLGTPLGNVPDQMKLAAVILTGKKWQPGRTLQIAFMGGDPRVIERVKDAASEWTRYANIRFSWDNGRGADIRIAFNPADGSWSYLGTDALTIPQNEPTMNFGWLEPDISETEYHRVVKHEFGHALGMPHEHQNPAGGIPWDVEAVYKYYSGPPNYWDKATIDSNLFERYEESQTVHTELDRASIMLYAIPNELTVGDWSVGWNTELSEMDKKFIEWQYPGASAPPPEKKTITKTKFCVTPVSQVRGYNVTLTSSGKTIGEFRGVDA